MSCGAAGSGRLEAGLSGSDHGHERVRGGERAVLGEDAETSEWELNAKPSGRPSYQQ